MKALKILKRIKIWGQYILILALEYEIVYAYAIYGSMGYHIGMGG